MIAIDIIKNSFSIQPENGPCGRVSRIMSYINELIKNVDGNIVEIGCGVGQTSYHLLSAAEENKRKFIAIDPWGTTYKSTGNKNGYTFAEFSKSVNIMSQSIIICQCESQDEKAISTIMGNAPIAFAFADGDVFTPESEYADIKMLADNCAEIICVDDQGKDSVRTALNMFKSGNDDYIEIGLPEMLECYLVRKQ